MLDLLIQRLLEVTSAADKYLVRLLECFKDLYKYHGVCCDDVITVITGVMMSSLCLLSPLISDQPLTFLYFTLHHYSAVFAGHHEWKLLLTYSIVGQS